ncbi:MAG: carbon storage regulator [Planctomycetaceae bacterium]|nr:carbon storage regulator [Planctomycetaceae bacterium]
MLVLSRKVGQKIVIDERVTLTVTRISGNRVSIGIEAPPGVHVRRSELELILGPDETLPVPEPKAESRAPTVVPTTYNCPDNGLIRHTC